MGLSAWRDKLLGHAPRPTVKGPTPVGIDFGTGCLKLLQLTVTETGTSISAAASLETPEELLGDPAKRLAFQAEALPKLLKAGGFKGKRGVCAIPASLSFCKHLKLTKADGLTVKDLVEASLVQQFGCMPSQMVFRHFEVAETPKAGGGTQTEVLCLAATRELVGRLMMALQAGGLAPVGMHCEQLALMRAFEPISRRTEDKTGASLYLDIGAGSTNMLIAQGASLLFSKRIEMGGRYLDETICRQTRCTLLEARRQRAEADGVVLVEGQGAGGRTQGSGPFIPGLTPVITPAATSPKPEEAATAVAERRTGSGGPVLSGDVAREAPRAFSPPKADLREALEILTDDIGLALRYYGSVFPQRAVERAVFVGGEARYRGLCQQIARSVRVSAQVGDPLASLSRDSKLETPGVDLKQPQPGWAVAMGLCLLPTDL